MNIQSAQIIASLNKGELHAHLNGLISTGIVRSILEQEKTEIPEGFDLHTDLIRLTPSASLTEYLKPWQVLRRIPATYTNLQVMCDDAFRGLHDNNVRFVELRSSVIYLAGLQNCTVHEALRRLIEATQLSARTFRIACGILLTVSRGDYSAALLETLLHAYRLLGCPSDVVGIDLAGDEEIPVPEELPRMFRAAKEKYGLGITIHAGETGRPENVLSAIREFGADRIGHGTAAGGHPEIMEELRRREICVEVCPISNRLTGALKGVESHPLRKFVQCGVPFVICSDNPGIHQRGINADYETALLEGINLDDLAEQYRAALRYTFLKGVL